MNNQLLRNLVLGVVFTAVSKKKREEVTTQTKQANSNTGENQKPEAKEPKPVWYGSDGMPTNEDPAKRYAMIGQDPGVAQMK